MENLTGLKPNKKAKIIVAIGALLNLANDSKSEVEAVTLDNLAAIDSGGVCMIVAKTPQMKRMLSIFIDKNKQEIKLPALIYYFNEEERNIEIASKYPIDYLGKIMRLMALFVEHPTIQIKSDYPLTIQNSNLKIILAPIVETNNNHITSHI